MKRFMKATAVAMALLLAGGTFAAEHPSEGEQPKAKEKAGLLDGKTFTGQIGKTGEDQGDKDKLVFQSGTFVSTACVEHGFQAVPYKAEEKDGVITFTAKATNDAKETMSWTGTIKNGKAEATAAHQTKSGKTEYWYKGAVKSKNEKPSDHPEKPEHPTSEHPQ